MYERSQSIADMRTDVSIAAQNISCRELLDRVPALRWLPGKSGNESGRWLPVWLHLMDTAGVMQYLLSSWLPGSVIDAAGLDDGVLPSVCRFLAMTHDIGKMTPLFAARLVKMLPDDIRDALERCSISSLSIEEYDTPNYNSPHTLAGSVILHSMGCRPSITAVIGAHHGKPLSAKSIALLSDVQFSSSSKNYYGYAAAGCKEFSDSPEGKLWDSIRRGWFGFALADAGYDKPDDLPHLSEPAQMLASGLLIMADWIASNTDYFPLIPTDDCGMDMDIDSRVKAAMTKLQLPDLWSSCRFSVTDDDFEDDFGFAPNDVQRALTDAAASLASGGIYILEAPMGCGKTEAALSAAEVLAAKNSSGGIFFGLPTQATANGIFGRIKAWAAHQSEGTAQAIRLAHGMAELNEDYAQLVGNSMELFSGEAFTNEDDESRGLVAHSWFKGNKQALLADFVIGTVDQLLMAVLKRKHMMLRHLGLAGKVVIVDECHAYDAYMNKYLDQAITWLGAYRVPVIILSATLPSSRRAELVKAYLEGRGEKERSICVDDSWSCCRAYPLLTWTDGAEVKQRQIVSTADSRRVAIERISDDDMVERVRDAVSAGGCTGVILNTVARAQNFAQLLRDAIPEAEVLLFHSHFTMHDRAERERDLLARIGKESTAQSRRGLVVVGTQVLEQSLDIDLDYLLTDLCPMDLLLQRLGRLHRHSWRERPDGLCEARCALLGATDAELESGSRKVYGDWPLLMARRLTPDVITLPDDIADLVQDAYGDVDDADEQLKQARAEHIKEIKKKYQKADTYCLAKPSRRSDKTINGVLDTDISDNEEASRAAVRDGIMSISVLVMVLHDDGTVGFAPWVHGGARVDAHSVPSARDARRIAAQRMNLPYVFNIGNRYMAAVEGLERQTKKLPDWQSSPWLDGELLLLFDDNMEAELCGFKLRYDREQGLVFETLKKGSDGDE